MVDSSVFPVKNDSTKSRGPRVVVKKKMFQHDTILVNSSTKHGVRKKEQPSLSNFKELTHQLPTSNRTSQQRKSLDPSEIVAIAVQRQLDHNTIQTVQIKQAATDFNSI